MLFRRLDETGWLRRSDLPKKLDHELSVSVEQYTQPLGGQHVGQETAATHGGLQVPGCNGDARRQQDD